VYLDLVCKFYSNIHGYYALSSSLTTYVRGKGISLTPQSLSRILKIPHVPNSQFSYPPDIAPSRVELGKFFGTSPWPFALACFLVHSIKLPKWMLALLIMSNLLRVLRRSNFTLDIAQFLYALLKNHRIDLASCIIDLIASIKLSKSKNSSLWWYYL
jgi:hypothetical protein